MWVHLDWRSRLQLFWDATARISPSTASSPDTPPAHRPAGLFFQANVVAVEWRAIGTIQKSSVNRCAGVLPRRRALIYARRDERCRQLERIPRVMERFGHKPSSQVPLESHRLNAQRLTHRRWLRSLKR